MAHNISDMSGFKSPAKPKSNGRHFLTDSQYDEIFNAVLNKSNSAGSDVTLKNAMKMVSENKQLSEELNESLNSSFICSQDNKPLSQPPKTLRHLQRLRWLQQRRGVGLWVMCSRPQCNKWRFLEYMKDPVDVPNEWICSMNKDERFNSCAVFEKGPTAVQEEDLIYNLYTAGSVVWGRVSGYPWWPAIVDDCPDVEQYYWLNGFSDIPTHYNLAFFDDIVSRAWLPPSAIVPYRETSNPNRRAVMNGEYAARIARARVHANRALSMEIPERLQKYSFIARWPDEIGTPLHLSHSAASSVCSESSVFKLIDTESVCSQPKSDRNNNSQSLGDSEKENREPEAEARAKHLRKKRNNGGGRGLVRFGGNRVENHATIGSRVSETTQEHRSQKENVKKRKKLSNTPNQSVLEDDSQIDGSTIAEMDSKLKCLTVATNETKDDPETQVETSSDAYDKLIWQFSQSIQEDHSEDTGTDTDAAKHGSLFEKSMTEDDFKMSESFMSTDPMTAPKTSAKPYKKKPKYTSLDIKQCHKRSDSDTSTASLSRPKTKRLGLLRNKRKDLTKLSGEPVSSSVSSSLLVNTSAKEMLRDTQAHVCKQELMDNSLNLCGSFLCFHGE